MSYVVEAIEKLIDAKISYDRISRHAATAKVPPPRPLTVNEARQALDSALERDRAAR